MEESEKQQLPDDIILQRILPLLPIKPLTQCKLLSKHYNSCISSPNFILKYTKQPLFPHPGPPVETLIIQSGESFYLYSCKNDDNVPEFHDDCHSEEDNLVKLDVEFPLDYRHGRMDLVGSSNGLVCIGEIHGKCFILYNPATNQSLKYYPGDSNLIENSQPLVYWGFGYVSSLDDHKVVRIMMYFNRKVSTVHVFSLRTNSWKKIEFDLVEGMLSRESKLVNETVYWVKKNNRRPNTTLAFDLVSETFEWFPHIVPRSSSWGPQMDYLIGGCLCVMGGCISKCDSNFPQGQEVMIDIYNRFGVIERITFGCGLRVDPEDDFVGFTKTGKVLVAHFQAGMLGLIDRNSKRLLVEFGNDSEGHRRLTFIQSYVPTYVSPYPSLDGPSSSPQGTWPAYREDWPSSAEVVMLD